MDDEGAIEIAKGQWKQLNSLNLSSNYISNRGLKHFRSANYQQLKSIHVFQIGYNFLEATRYIKGN
jgi:hypothetical protein